MQNRKRLPLLLTALMLVFCIALTGCAGRRSVTAEDFSAACKTAGFEVTDASESFDASVILTALTVTDESVSAGLFVFASADSARSNYAQMLSGVKTGASGENSSIPANTTGSISAMKAPQRCSTATAQHCCLRPAATRKSWTRLSMRSACNRAYCKNR